MKINLTYIIFLFVGIVWGSNFIYMKIVTDYLNDLQIVYTRVLFGFLPVLFYSLSQKTIKINHIKYIHHFFIMSLLGTSIYYYYYIKAASLIPSSISGILSATIPMFTFLIAIIFIKDEIVSLKKFIGILFGFTGIIIISKPFDINVSQEHIEGITDILLGSIILASSFIYAKKFIIPLKIHFSALTTYQLGFAFITLSFLVDYRNFDNILINYNALFGLTLGLGLLGTGIAFICYYYLIEHIGAIKASSATYLPPIVAMIIGYFLADEDLSIFDLLSCSFIFLGLYLVNKKDSKKS